MGMNSKIVPVESLKCEQCSIGRETMSPSLQDKVGSKRVTISEAGVHFIPMFTVRERSRKREQVKIIWWDSFLHSYTTYYFSY
jgi:hypothetical protein